MKLSFVSFDLLPEKKKKAIDSLNVVFPCIS